MKDCILIIFTGMELFFKLIQDHPGKYTDTYLYHPILYRMSYG
jgi:hypothetical protein